MTVSNMTVGKGALRSSWSCTRLEPTLRGSDNTTTTRSENSLSTTVGAELAGLQLHQRVRGAPADRERRATEIGVIGFVGRAAAGAACEAAKVVGDSHPPSAKNPTDFTFGFARLKSVLRLR